MQCSFPILPHPSALNDNASDNLSLETQVLDGPQEEEEEEEARLAMRAVHSEVFLGWSD
jgi:hypothetical protein